ncbi:TPA: helix-turn-helix domain-containing protein [Stenotrophomonas maltophilia]
MTLAEAAERSACSPKTILRAIDAGQLVAVRLGASTRSDRIHPADLEDWWQRSRQQATVAPAAPRASQSVPRPGSADERLAALLKTSK